MANQFQNGQQLPPYEHDPNNNSNSNSNNSGNTNNGSGDTSLGKRRAGQSEAFREKLRRMALPLAPLVQLTTGQVHPAFPGTILNFWLLTGEELEALAAFYHQGERCEWTRQYPCPIPWERDLPLETKRRRIGRFIGLRGFDTPVRVLSEEEILEEARRARRQEEEEMWRRKLPWY